MEHLRLLAADHISLTVIEPKLELEKDFRASRQPAPYDSNCVSTISVQQDL